MIKVVLIKHKSSNMKIIFLFIALIFSIIETYAQRSRIEDTMDKSETETHINFLASDELRGRASGTIEADISGRYIAEQFRKFDLNLPGAASSYLQHFNFTATAHGKNGKLTVADKEYISSEDFAIINGANQKIIAPAIVLNSFDKIESVSVKGKIVVAYFENDKDYSSLLEILREKGAHAFIYLFDSQHQVDFKELLNYFSKDKYTLGSVDNQDSLLRLILNDQHGNIKNHLINNTEIIFDLNLEKASVKKHTAFNVVGFVEGTNEVLKNEYIVLSAHYDHIGVKSGLNEGDSIYNGTRDNAIGTAGLINAAQYFRKYPPKRSILLIAFAAEELGLFGSEYYANHPLIPLQQCVYNLNIDNPGYNDTGKITMFGNGRTNVDELVRRSAKEFDLEAIEDPVPDENFLERSDQVNFMNKGVPAMQFAMGITAMDDEINKYYHQLSDEFSTVDKLYVHKYLGTYLLAAENIANWDKRPYWTKGDKFEKIAEELYAKRNK